MTPELSVEYMSTKSTSTGIGADTPRSTLQEVGRELAARPYARRGVSARAEPIRVLLVDDHNLVRAGMKLVLRAFPEPGMGASLALRSTRPEVGLFGGNVVE